MEEITAPVEATPASRPTKKDPKKVAAGKALARKNKEAKEAKLILDGRQQVEGSSRFDTFQNASILVGSALVLYHGYQAIRGRSPLTNPLSKDGGGAPFLVEPPEENSIQME